MSVKKIYSLVYQKRNNIMKNDQKKSRKKRIKKSIKKQCCKLIFTKNNEPRLLRYEYRSV